MSKISETVMRETVLSAGYSIYMSPVTAAIAIAAVNNLSNEYNWADIDSWDALESDIDQSLYELMTPTGSVNMLGAIQPFAGSTAPDGWLVCDGSTFNTGDYPDLYTYLGTDTLPNLVGRLLMGADDIDVSLYSEGGDDGVALTTNNLPSHYHSVNNHAHSRGVITVGYGAFQVGGGVAVASVVLGNTGGASPDTSSVGANQRFKIIPPVFGVTWFIRAVV